ncbi:hypothetical protein P879_10129 [Paragonimus westermani]|uniref:RRM domain-containing protein n=1 Tax=Paragonimus westermani TaxID=34504 RepID=A0A8T0DA50_9TREM|nr:hypothetical protein P879_10129 [Paragonimus westermani]
MSTQEDLLDFEEQLRLQNLQPVRETSKTRVDPDGTVMEWDNRRKAWFPKKRKKQDKIWIEDTPEEVEVIVVRHKTRTAELESSGCRQSALTPNISALSSVGRGTTFYGSVITMYRLDYPHTHTHDVDEIVIEGDPAGIEKRKANIQQLMRKFENGKCKDVIIEPRIQQLLCAGYKNVASPFRLIYYTFSEVSVVWPVNQFEGEMSGAVVQLYLSNSVMQLRGNRQQVDAAAERLTKIIKQGLTYTRFRERHNVELIFPGQMETDAELATEIRIVGLKHAVAKAKMELESLMKTIEDEIDDDFIARYQMSYGVATNQDEPSITTDTAAAAPHDGCMNWSSFNAQLAKLRETKGEQSEEVQALTRAAHESLTAYYNSPAYREWYASYCKQRETPEEDAKVAAVQHKSAKSTKLRTDLKPSERVRQALANDGEDAEIALARAEAEQQAGVPLCVEQDATNMQSDQTHELNDKKSGDSNASKPVTKRKQAAPPPAWYEMEDDKNTHVYVTGLPPEITEEEFLELMSKYGVVMNEPFVDKPRIKLYRDEHGKPKGDGRCCYVKRCSPRSFKPLKHDSIFILFRWGIDTSKFVRSKKERVLVLKNAFLEFDFVRDVTLIPCVRDRIRTECAKCGTVKKIVVHDTNPLGVVTVTFSSPEEADTALSFLDKALFNYPGTGGARQLLVERWDGKTNYSVKEDKDEELSRIHNWEKFLGGDQSSSDEGDELQEKDAEIEAVVTAHGQLEGSTELAADYWEASSQESPTSQVDTDEASGNSGDETT